MEDIKRKLYTILRVVAVTACIYLVFKYMLPVVLPFIIACALYRWVYPAVSFINKKTHIPESMIASVLLFTGTIILFILFVLIGKYILGQVWAIVDNADSMMRMFRDLCFEICGYIGKIFRCDQNEVYQWMNEFVGKIGENMHVWIAEFLSSTGIVFIKNVIILLVILLIALLSTVLLIKDIKQIDRQIQKSPFAADIFEISSKIWDVVGCFIKSQMIIILVISGVCCAGLALAGINYSVLIGFTIGILDALPIIGSGTILMPWAVIRLVTGKYKTGIILLVVYVICALLRELLEARLMGSHLGINEFYMLMATFTGINLFGFFGIILGPLGLILILEILRMLSIYMKSCKILK